MIMVYSARCGKIYKYILCNVKFGIKFSPDRYKLYGELADNNQTINGKNGYQLRKQILTY